MVRALQRGIKTQTRRLVKSEHIGTTNPPHEVLKDLSPNLLKDAASCCPQGRPGDQLWVKETHTFYSLNFEGLGTWHPVDRDICCHYREGCPLELEQRLGNWRPSIFMPRWASRIQLQITDVRVEPLNAISEEDAIAEGIDVFEDGAGFSIPLPSGKLGPWQRNPVDAYRNLWEAINGPASWSANPWVFVISFKRIPT